MLTILQGDAVEQLRTLPDESVHCCVTSPPYWGLRDYGTAQWEGGGDHVCDHKRESQGRPTWGEGSTGSSTLEGKPSNDNHEREAHYGEKCGKCGAKRIDSQLGLEKTPEEYVAKMVEVFGEVRRVLRKDGTLWLNLGDSYASDFKGSGGESEKQLSNAGSFHTWSQRLNHGLKPKDLCGIPWRVAFALQADGWWLRSDIIWAKPNPMPESVTDRPTKAHEYLFLLTKSASYFYDSEAIKERGIWSEDRRKDDGRLTYDGKRQGGKGEGQEAFVSIQQNRNKRSVWTIATAPYPEAHFATYPPDLVKPCILAGTSAKGCCAKCGSPWERITEPTKEYQQILDRGRNDPSWKGERRRKALEIGVAFGDKPEACSSSYKTIGWQPTCECQFDQPLGSDFPTHPCTVLDPFAGSGTTGAVALELGRKAILIELNPKYVGLIKQRCNVTPGLQLC